MVIQFYSKERSKALKNKILTGGMRLFFNIKLISAYSITWFFERIIQKKTILQKRIVFQNYLKRSDQRFIPSNTFITSLTATADSFNNAFSSSVNCSSMIFSIPFLPRITGTPR